MSFLRLFSILTLCLLSRQVLATTDQKPFEIPRSLVIEVTDDKTGRVYPLFIKLPKSFNRDSSRKYPVIYLTDAWYAFQIVSGATRYPMNVGKMKEAIIVGISYAKGSKRDNSRVRDYTPTLDKSWTAPTGFAHQHMAFIQDVVMKTIEQDYRGDTKNRTFVGNSLGGLFGSYILMTKPDLFKNYILGSPSYWYDNKVIFELERQFAKKKLSVNANVFIAIGERETKALESHHQMVQDARSFYQKMLAWRQPKLNAKLLIIPQANHQTAFPTTAIQGLYWALAI